MLNSSKFARLHETKVHVNLFMVAVDTKMRSLFSEISKTCFCIVGDDWNWNLGFLLAKTVTTLSLLKRRGVDNFPDSTSPAMGLLQAFYKHLNIDQHDLDADLYGLAVYCMMCLASN
jgi:hypothetical protein